MTIYAISEWSDHFEKSQTKKCKNARWVPVPIQHDGKGYRRLAMLPEFPEIFAAWILILQVASKMPERGVLADTDGPLTPEDLSFMTGLKAKHFEKALSVLSDASYKIGWIEARTAVECQSNGAPPTGQDITEQDKTEQSTLAPNGKAVSKPSPIRFDKESQEFSGIADKQISKWVEAYPAVDVKIEILKAAQWLVANPKKAPRSNYNRFLTNWLSRTQDRGGSIPSNPKGQVTTQSTGQKYYFKDYAEAIWSAKVGKQDDSRLWQKARDNLTRTEYQELKDLVTDWQKNGRPDK
jgi:hypothetical protein